jgi:hypothetical protein
MIKHALLGPSGASRWIACPPSARFEQEFEEPQSEYAEEGTAAHELADLFLLGKLGELPDAEWADAYQLFTENNKHYNGEMEEAVGLYLDIVGERFAEAKKRDKSAILMSEQKLDFSEYVPGGFGTGDAIIIGGGLIEIIDLKYGKGVPVDAEGNPQLKLYGLAAWNTYKILYEIETVRMTIVQPRLGSVTTALMSVEELVEWTIKEVTPKAQLAWKGKGDYIPGDHCRFCKAKPRCKALANHHMELAKHDFVLPHKLNDTEIGEILGQLDNLIKWSTAVKEYALDQAMNHGVKWPGWKLVEGRSNRRITDDIEAVNILVEDGVAEPLLYKPKEMLGITALEKLVGKKKLTTLLDNIIEKPPGKPTLVPQSDKRPELNSAANAAADFGG